MVQSDTASANRSKYEYDEPKKLTISQLTALLVAVLLLGAGFVAGMYADKLYAAIAPVFGLKVSADSIDLSSVQQTYRKLKAEYDGKLDDTKLIDGANRGLAAATGDPYTTYMDKQETEQFDRSLNGEVSGIGVEIASRGNHPTVVRVVDDSPAAKAGLRAGDIFRSINGQSVEGQNSEVVASKVRGEAGTTVKLVMQREESTEEYTIIRAKVSDASVRSQIRDGVGILTITRFDDQTGRLARQAAEQFVQQGVRAVVLDLRDNGGGYVTAAREVASLWLENKVVVVEKSGDVVRDTVHSSGQALLKGMKTIVLVNGNSASASEIVAGALHDHKVATLLGEKTFGKGTVQQLFNLPDGRKLKITVARWYTPSGRNISQGGIAPDTEVKMSTDDRNAGRDPQLDSALQKFAE